MATPAGAFTEKFVDRFVQLRGQTLAQERFEQSLALSRQSRADALRFRQQQLDLQRQQVAARPFSVRELNELNDRFAAELFARAEDTPGNVKNISSENTEQTIGAFKSDLAFNSLNAVKQNQINSIVNSIVQTKGIKSQPDAEGKMSLGLNIVSPSDTAKGDTGPGLVSRVGRVGLETAKRISPTVAFATGATGVIRALQQRSQQADAPTIARPAEDGNAPTQNVTASEFFNAQPPVKVRRISTGETGPISQSRLQEALDSGRFELVEPDSPPAFTPGQALELLDPAQRPSTSGFGGF
jgi:hypothetical protein